MYQKYKQYLSLKIINAYLTILLKYKTKFTQDNTYISYPTFYYDFHVYTRIWKSIIWWG